MAVSIRRVDPAEYVEAGRVTRAGYETDGFLVRSDGTFDDLYAGRLSDVATRDHEAVVLVAGESDTLLGTVTWCPPGSPWRDLARDADQAEFRMLSVAPEGRGRGVGAALVSACLDRARVQGASVVLLSSLAQMVPAHRLYDRLGFRRAPDLDHTPHPGVDLLAFRLEL